MNIISDLEIFEHCFCSGDIWTLFLLWRYLNIFLLWRYLKIISALEIFEHYWNCLCHHVAISRHVKLPSQGYFPRSLVFHINQEHRSGFPDLFSKYVQIIPVFQKEEKFAAKFVKLCLFRRTMLQIRPSKLLGLCPTVVLGKYTCCRWLWITNSL